MSHCFVSLFEIIRVASSFPNECSGWPSCIFLCCIITLGSIDDTFIWLDLVADLCCELMFFMLLNWKHYAVILVLSCFESQKKWPFPQVLLLFSYYCFCGNFLLLLSLMLLIVCVCVCMCLACSLAALEIKSWLELWPKVINSTKNIHDANSDLESQ